MKAEFLLFKEEIKMTAYKMSKENKMKRVKEFLLNLIIFIVLIGVVGGLALLVITSVKNLEERKDNTNIIYNNGIHENCGEWRFISAAGNDSCTYYYYECTECHKVLKSAKLYNQVKIEEKEGE